jgi:hypothetical protein
VYKYTEINVTFSWVGRCDPKQTKNGSHAQSTNHNGTTTTNTVIMMITSLHMKMMMMGKVMMTATVASVTTLPDLLFCSCSPPQQQ